MTDCRVVVAGDTELPADIEWAFVRTTGDTLFVVKRASLCARVLREARAAREQLLHGYRPAAAVSPSSSWSLELASSR